jgi:plastocyanin
VIPIPVPVPLLITIPSFNPPPGYEQVREIPSYAVRIPFSSDGRSQFDPPNIAIPGNLTVIWFNDDQNPHTITVNKSSSELVDPNATFDSGFMAPFGTFVHQFTTPGTYVYYDRLNPSAKAQVTVGDMYAVGKNIDMLVGGDILPFNASKLERLTLSFVPHGNVSTLPPSPSIAYNVSISNSTSGLISQEFVDTDGILDLELMPVSKASSAKQFKVWGPDVADRPPGGPFNDGTFHIQGPVLVDYDTYVIDVSIVAKDGKLLPSPITDTFVLPSVGSQ